MEEARKIEEGVTQELKITGGREGSYYWVSGARKPVGFLGPAQSTLVGRVDHEVWQQGSYHR